MIFRLLCLGAILLPFYVGCAPSNQSSSIKKGKSTDTENTSSPSQGIIFPPNGGCFTSSTGSVACAKVGVLESEVVIAGDYYATEVLKDIPRLSLLSNDFDVQRLENIGELTVLRKNYDKILQMNLSSVGVVRIQE